jgi:hypothetical protein
LQIVRSLAYTLLTAVVIVIPIGTLAQSHGPGEMLRAADVDTGSSPSFEFAAVSVGALPEAPVPRKTVVIDKKFIAVMAALGGAESLRITTHKLVLDHEYAAGAPWVTSVPANSHLAAKFAGIYTAETLVAFELKKPHPWLPGDRVVRKLWWVYPSAMAAMHVANGVRSIRTQPPSGCPVAVCQ